MRTWLRAMRSSGGRSSAATSPHTVWLTPSWGWSASAMKNSGPSPVKAPPEAQA
eukprot:CAMPEP_0183348492 /NCGR_PEP_ID=MMETSP0164_2-20130417/12986_1 /TAXON_ID=221442 /ORGANISM="Coccolithus pelagicus ssp braarudi, Strain PLY182g" /LENGTH=53 /DNA_ID=CAMNT_0025520097 /DNA_START=366 /DNA_END=523 /DNA_ORIENTATION=+